MAEVVMVYPCLWEFRVKIHASMINEADGLDD